MDLARDSGIEKWDKTCRQVRTMALHRLALCGHVHVRACVNSYLSLISMQTFLRLAKVEESAGIRGGGGGGMILNPVVGPEPITG